MGRRAATATRWVERQSSGRQQPAVKGEPRVAPPPLPWTWRGAEWGREVVIGGGVLLVTDNQRTAAAAAPPVALDGQRKQADAAVARAAAGSSLLGDELGAHPCMVEVAGGRQVRAR